MKLPGVFFMLFLVAGWCHAQDPVTDSLKKTLQVAMPDTSQVNLLNLLSSKLIGTQPDEALKYAVNARDLAEKIGFDEGQAYGLKNIGRVYYVQGKYADAVVVWRQSLRLFEKHKDENGQANLLNNIGAVFYDQGDNQNALSNYLKSLAFSERTGNKLRMATAMVNIGSVYTIQKNTSDKALEYFSRALVLGQEMDYKDVVSLATVNMGEIFLQRNLEDSALHYFKLSLKALAESNDTASMPYTYNDMGKMYRMQKDYAAAEKYHDEAYRISKLLDAKPDMALSLLGLAETYDQKGDMTSSLNFYKQAEPLALELNSKEDLKIIYQGLAKVYTRLKDYKTAVRYQDLLSGIKDSIYNTETDSKIAKLEYNFNIQKKEGEITLLTKDKALQDLDLRRQKTMRNSLMAGLFLVLIIAFVIYRNYRIKVKTNQILDSQKAQIEGLLLNILPVEVAGELQKTGNATPRYHESVSVLFSDFKNFTKIAEGLSPQDLVSELNAHFMAFDNIIERYQLEKIKTIGDSYMCAGGIPTASDTHAVDLVRASLEMQEYIKAGNGKRIEMGMPLWELRIGIHTGPVVAGVVGRKKYAYDIWGSTVNIASRLESNGEAGLVNISAATYELIRDRYACMYRGKIYAKNIGEIDMYLIEAEIPLRAGTEMIGLRVIPETAKNSI